MRNIKRHSLADRLMHWCNAALWLALFFTGAALMHNEALAPFGQRYPVLIREWTGGGANLLRLHIGLGVAWVAAFVLYCLGNAASAVFFLREIFSIRPGDLLWLRRKPPLMLLGRTMADKAGLSLELPAQGYYNMGQKAFGMLAVTGGLLLAATGVIMAAGWASAAITGWLVVIHYIACGLVFCGLLVHLYMTLAVPDERPGLCSMFSGSVSADYARRHHENWFKTL